MPSAAAECRNVAQWKAGSRSSTSTSGSPMHRRAAPSGSGAAVAVRTPNRPIRSSPFGGAVPSAAATITPL